MTQRSASTASIAVTFAAISLAACGTRDTAGRQPLGEAASATTAAQSESGPPLPQEALAALDAGNAAYRAKKFDVAVAKYRDATVAAPKHAAPWFGLYMVANEMKNTALADSAMVHVKELSADPAALDAHAQVSSPSSAASGGALPPGHPTTQQLPPGHPSPSAQPKAGTNPMAGKKGSA